MRNLGIVLLALGLLLVTVLTEEAYEQHQRLGGERYVAGMSGIGTGWIDTLRTLVNRDVVVDTLTTRIIEVENVSTYSNLLGLHERYYNQVRINPDLGAYVRFSRSVTQPTGMFMGYQHPAWLAYPSVVLAHEFGHVYQENSRWAHWHKEIFADHFANAMMVIRGWVPLDRSNQQLVQLHHELWFKLMISQWRGE